MIRWVSTFIDVPADRFGATVAFWSVASATMGSEPRGDDGQFVTLVPAQGTADLGVQRFERGPRLHVDLHVDDLAAARRRAVDVGAIELADLGFVIMRSPGGFTFCLVRARGDEVPSPALTDPAPHLIDQLCIDVPASGFDTECAFWSALVGGDLSQSENYPEFLHLSLGDGVGFHFLLQRLGNDDVRTQVEAHLDLSCGDAAAAVADRHVALGAERIGIHHDWIVMRDPAGLEYCTTASPVTR